MTSQLDLYNAALRNIGQRKLADLTEDVELRYLLDDVWDDDFVDQVLEQGLWNFATRTVELTYEPSIEPSFGYRRAFSKPADWLRTSALSSNGHFDPPLNAYVDETGYWFCEMDTIYVRYISNDDQFGGDLSAWPRSFTMYAACHMAVLMAPHPTRSQEMLARLEKQAEKLLIKAKTLDAANEGAKFFPTGSWTNARRGGRFSTRNREHG
jgi:hypothetical protein